MPKMEVFLPTELWYNALRCYEKCAVTSKVLYGKLDVFLVDYEIVSKLELPFYVNSIY